MDTPMVNSHPVSVPCRHLALNFQRGEFRIKPTLHVCEGGRNVAKRAVLLVAKCVESAHNNFGACILLGERAVLHFGEFALRSLLH
jgi:hypothetical protein